MKSENEHELAVQMSWIGKFFSSRLSDSVFDSVS